MEIKVYTIKEISNLLKIHRTYVSRLIKEGKLNAAKIGRSYRVLEEDLEKFLGEKIKKPLLKASEVGKILKIHRLYVMRLIKDKKIKAIKIGKFYRVSEKALEDFVKEKPLSKIMTAEEVGKKLQLSRLTIINLIKEKKLPAFKIGKFYRVTEKMLAKFLKVKEL